MHIDACRRHRRRRRLPAARTLTHDTPRVPPPCAPPHLHPARAVVQVWFTCDDCGDSIKKPKLQQHMNSCSARGFTCIDCSACFDRRSVQGHTQCVTEHEKYALGATKPGGYAATGYAAQQGSGGAKPAADGGCGRVVGSRGSGGGCPMTTWEA